MVQNEDNLDVNQRVGVVQTYNEKGENCGRIVLAGDLDAEVAEKLRVFELFKDFIKTYLTMTVGSAQYLNWDHQPPTGPKVVWKIGSPEGKEPTKAELEAFRQILSSHVADPRQAIIIHNEEHGVCPWCDYGGGQNLKEHESRCELRRAVEWFDKHDPVFPPQDDVLGDLIPVELKKP